MVADLIHNLALLLATSMLFTYLSRFVSKDLLYGELLFGILFGLITIVGMYFPFRLMEGLIFDGRSVIISIAALFCGPITAVVVIVIAAIYRIWIGGVGTLMGVSVIFASGIIGLIARLLLSKTNSPVKIIHLFVLGITVHIVMLILTAFLPSSLTFEVAGKIALPVMIIYTLSTILLGYLLIDQEDKNQSINKIISSENKFRNLFDYMSSGVVIYSAVDNGKNFIINDINPAGLLNTKTKIEEVRGKLVTEVFPGIKAIGLLDVFQKVYETGEPEIVPANLYIDQRLKHWFENYVFKLDNGDLVAIYDDISERKGFEKILRESEEKFRTIYEQSPIAIEIFNSNGELIDVNQQTLNLFGIDDSKHVLGFKLFEDPNISDEEIIKLKNGQPIFISAWFDFELVKKKNLYPTTKSGMMYWDLFINPIHDSNGKISGYLAQVLETTESKLTEEALKTSEERMRMLVEGTPYLFFYTQDINANITYISPSVEKITGHSVEQWIGQNHWFITDSEINNYAKAITLTHLKGEFSNNPILVEVKHSEDRPILLEVYEVPIMKNNKVMGLQGVAHDITERNNAEKELNRFQELLKETGRLAKVGGWEFDTITFKGTWTNEVARIHDLNPEDPTNVDKGISYYEPESRKKIEAAIDEAVKFAKPYDLELELTSAKGVHKWIRTIGHPITENGRVVKVRGSFQDITSQKLAEKALVESEERFRLSFRTSPDSVNINRMDDGVYVDINEGFTKTTGYTEKDVIGKSSFEINIWKNQKDREKLVEGLKKENSVRNLEAKFVLKDGTAIDGLMSASVINLGGIPHIISVTRDISEIKKTQEALTKSESKLQSILRVAPVGVGIVVDRIITYVNAHLINMIGYSEKELLGKSSRILYENDDEYERVGKIKYRLIKSYGEGSLETHFKCKDGTIKDVILSSRAIDPSDLSIGVTFTALDITEKNIAEEKIRKSKEELSALTGYLQKLREEERAAIAREIHDELGQVLTSIKMNLSIIGKEINKNDKPDKKYLSSEFNSMANIIDASVIRVRKLITDLRPELLDKLGLIPAIEWLLEEFSKSSAIKCSLNTNINEIDISPDIGIVIYRVIQEALTNASKHSNANNVNVDFNLLDNIIKIKIQDDGQGFSAQGKKNRRTFGLLGMRERALLIGGKLNIESAKDKGTSVTLEIMMPNSDN